MNDQSDVFYMRDTSNEDKDVSMGFNYLSNERGTLVKNKTVIFKYGCFIIPIMRTWGLAETKVVGVFILSGLTQAKSSLGRKSQIKEDQISISGISSVVRDLSTLLTTAFNLSFLETYNMKLSGSYNSIRNVGKSE